MSTTTLIATALIICCTPLRGQEMRTDTMAGSWSEGMVKDYVYRDLVGNDMGPTTDLNTAMQRSVLSTAKGYAVRVVAADGTLRMCGTYADEGLITQHGQFKYYHPNGRSESTGMYVNGLKKGIWERSDAQGHDKAERIYGAGSYEELAIEHGWSTDHPRTVGR